MFASKQMMLRILLSALVLGCISALVSPSSGQVSLIPPLSPGAQQMLLAILSGMPPNDRPLVLNAIRALGPRAEMELERARQIPPEAGAGILQTLQALPFQYHQPFIDGLFEVTQDEEAFAQQILTAVARRPPVTGPDPWKRYYENGMICSHGATTSYCGPGSYGPPYYPY